MQIPNEIKDDQLLEPNNILAKFNSYVLLEQKDRLQKKLLNNLSSPKADKRASAKLTTEITELSKQIAREQERILSRNQVRSGFAEVEQMIADLDEEPKISNTEQKQLSPRSQAELNIAEVEQIIQDIGADIVVEESKRLVAETMLDIDVELAEKALKELLSGDEYKEQPKPVDLNELAAARAAADEALIDLYGVDNREALKKIAEQQIVDENKDMKERLAQHGIVVDFEVDNGKLVNPTFKVDMNRYNTAAQDLLFRFAKKLDDGDYKSREQLFATLDKLVKAIDILNKPVAQSGPPVNNVEPVQVMKAQPAYKKSDFIEALDKFDPSVKSNHVADLLQVLKEGLGEDNQRENSNYKNELTDQQRSMIEQLKTLATDAIKYQDEGKKIKCSMTKGKIRKLIAEIKDERIHAILALPEPVERASAPNEGRASEDRLDLVERKRASLRASWGAKSEQNRTNVNNNNNAPTASQPEQKMKEEPLRPSFK